MENRIHYLRNGHLMCGRKLGTSHFERIVDEVEFKELENSERWPVLCKLCLTNSRKLRQTFYHKKRPRLIPDKKPSPKSPWARTGSRWGGGYVSVDKYIEGTEHVEAQEDEYAII